MKKKLFFIGGSSLQTHGLFKSKILNIFSETLIKIVADIHSILLIHLHDRQLFTLLFYLFLQLQLAVLQKRSS